MNAIAGAGICVVICLAGYGLGTIFVDAVRGDWTPFGMLIIYAALGAVLGSVKRA